MISWLKSNPAIPIALVSLLVAMGSLWISVFKSFIQGPRMGAQLTQINFLRVAQGGIKALLPEMLADDLLSASPSASAKKIADTYPPIGTASGREQVLAAIHSAASAVRFPYNPPDAIIRRYFGHASFAPFLYVPLLITNGGARVGHISSLVLVASDARNQKMRWAFVPFFEVNVPVLLDRSREHTDVERTKSIFSGLAVPPGSSAVVDPVFIPLHDANHTIISRQNLLPGTYQFTVFAYAPNGDLMFRTQAVEYTVKPDLLVAAFNGSDNIDSVLIEKHVSDAIKR